MFHANTISAYHQAPPAAYVSSSAHSIVESNEILLEFQSANDRLQQKRRAGDWPNGVLSDNNNVMLQGNLGIFVERDGVENASEYSHCNMHDYAGPQEMADGMGYGQYYRGNSSSYNSTENGNESHCAGRMDYIAMELSALYANRS